jgi:putative membrane protein
LYKGCRVSSTEKQGRQNPSRVRDHLANERTYLAWMRSAIALMGFGVVIVRLRYFQIPELPHPGTGWRLGLLFSMVGLMTVLLSTLYYFLIRRNIDDDSYEPSTRRVIFFSFCITVLGTAVIYYVFTATAHPTGFLISE